MDKIKIGILGTSDIAFRRFLPALAKNEQFEYVGIATRNPEKAKQFADLYGGNIYEGYERLLEDDAIDAVYIPLPPALHYTYAMKALEHGKHVLLEKPFTTSEENTKALLKEASNKNLAVYENFMFLYHDQLSKIKSVIADGSLGDIRLYKMAFGFPKRSANDFRYNKQLGGGALLDCGCYTVRMALELLGASTKVTSACLNTPVGQDVEFYGCATLENSQSVVAQVGFGMDNEYRCELDIWGSKGSLLASRVFTAGTDVCPEIVICKQGQQTKLVVPAQDQFFDSIGAFEKCITDVEYRSAVATNISTQSELIQQVLEIGNRK